MSWTNASAPLAAAALVSVLAVATPSLAQSDNTAMAQSLFESGRALMKEGKVKEACPKFAESNRLEPSAGTLLNLGRCREALGQSASAWASYKKAVVVGRAKGQERHVTAAKEYIEEIEPKLSRLTIESPDAVEGLSIRRGEVKLSAAALGVPIVVNPGDYEVEATAPGYQSWTGRITIAPDGDAQTLTVPRLEPAEPGAAGPVGDGEPDGRPEVGGPDDTTAEPKDEGTDPLWTAGLVVGGIGIVGVGVGAAFGVMTFTDADAAENDESLCPKMQCTEEGLQAVDDAKTKALVSNIALGVGGAAVVAGIVLVLLSGGSDADATGATNGDPWKTVRVSPALGPGHGAFNVTGTF